MAQKALGSCDWVGTHVVWLAKSLGIMRFGWNSYMVWLKKTPKKRRRKRNPTSDVYKRQREKQHLCQKTIQNYPVFFSSVCHFRIYSDIRISAGCFGVLEICVTCCFGVLDICVTSDFRRGLFRSFGDMCHFGISDIRISEGCFGVLEICVTSEFRIFVFQSVVSEF